VRVMEKLGLRREPIRAKDHVRRGGELIDEAVYAVDLTTVDRG